MEIEVRNLSKKSGGHSILLDVSLRISGGGIFILMGSNGAGKTTLLKIIGLLDRPTAGDLLFDNRSVSRLGPRQKTALRRRLGFVFQYPLLLNGTVIDNMLFGLKIRELTISMERLEQTLEAVGLSARKKTDVSLLSGGEKQRLQLARAMTFDPDVLLADEPTSNLDPLSTGFIEDQLRRMSAAGKTVILATHNLFQAHLLGDRIFFISEGRIVQQGTTRQVMENPATLDVAHFSPFTNILRGWLTQKGEEVFLQVEEISIQVAAPFMAGPVAAVLRPEDLIVSRETLHSSARNCLQGKVIAVDDLGMIVILRVECRHFLLHAAITRQSLNQMGIKPGDGIYLTFKASAVYLLPE